MKKYIVNTNIPTIINIRYPQKDDILSTGTGKPRGLWYSIGYDWHEFVDQNLSRPIYEHDIHIKMDRSRMLIIDSQEKALQFHKEFIGPSKLGKHFREINWKMVKRKYKGLEITDPVKFHWGFFGMRGEFDSSLETNYMYSWDLPSGVIWDLSILESWDVKKSDWGKKGGSI